jgi:membrane-associated phospholipid phosphatase
MRRRSWLCGALFGLAVPLTAVASTQDEHPQWTRSGDLLQWGIPLTALGVSFLFGSASPPSFDLAASGSDGVLADGLNWPGPRLHGSLPETFAISFARMELTTYGLKYAIDEKRPNGGGHGFPSGHSAAAFMGAEFIRKNYGNGWGAPAYLLAGWVGYTRVESHNHYWHDVAGGALVGIASNYDFDRVETPVGAVSLGPTLMSASTPDLDGESTALCGEGCRQMPSVPGILLQLRF